MPPVWPPRWVGRIFSCRFTRLTPSTSTLLRPGSTRSTRPLAVMSLPAITITRSSLWIFMVLQHLWRETDDLHGTRVVGDLESRLLLDHLLGPLHDLGHPPALGRRQGTGLEHADEVTHLGALLVVGLELGRPPDRLAIQAVLAKVLDLHHHRLLHLVGDDHTEPRLALATGAGGRRRRFLVRHCLSPLSYLRRPSLRLAAGRTVATAVGTASPASSRCRMAVRMRAMSLRTSPSRWPFSS